MVGDPSCGWVNSQRRGGRSRDYVSFRRRVRMVSFETLRTFEMILAVSLTRLDSSLTSKDSLVEILTIMDKEGLIETRIHWISLRTNTSGSTHPFEKK